jgi:ATP-binding cassette subfamily B (MDR/TAP) protein 1
MLLVQQGIDNNLGTALRNGVCAATFVIMGLIYAWKLALVLLTILPLISGCGALMYIMSKKYKNRELQAYEDAGQLVQNVFSSIKTVYAFNLQKTFVDLYKSSLDQARSTTTKKGLVFGLFNGAVEALMLIMFGIGLLYATYLSQNECETFSYSSLLSTLMFVIHCFSSLSNALAFLNLLSQGKLMF